MKSRRDGWRRKIDNLIGSRICGGNPAGKRKESDFYPTPPEATQALLDFLMLKEGTSIWEPACGEGHMEKVMIENGYIVRGTDIAYGVDFLKTEENISDWIITNPPFSQSEAFIKKCAEYGVPFALLLKSQYWHAARRVALFSEVTPTYVLPLTWRPDFNFSGGSPVMDVIWCVWLPGTEGTRYIPLKKPKMQRGGKND